MWRWRQIERATAGPAGRLLRGRAVLHHGIPQPMSDTLVVVVAGAPPWALSLITGCILGVFLGLIIVGVTWGRSR